MTPTKKMDKPSNAEQNSYLVLTHIDINDHVQVNLRKIVYRRKTKQWKLVMSLCCANQFKFQDTNVPNCKYLRYHPFPSRNCAVKVVQVV